MPIKKIEIGRKPISYTKMDSLATAQACPGGLANGSMVTIQGEAQPIRYRPDGVAPTSTVGVLLLDGQMHTLITDAIEDIQIIETAVGGIAHVTVYK